MMGFGVATTVRLLGALLNFFSEACFSLAEAAEYVGDPEVTTTCALVVVALVASGRWCQGAVALVIFSAADIVYKDFVGPSVEGP